VTSFFKSQYSTCLFVYYICSNSVHLLLRISWAYLITNTSSLWIWCISYSLLEWENYDFEFVYILRLWIYVYRLGDRSELWICKLLHLLLLPKSKLLHSLLCLFSFWKNAWLCCFQGSFMCRSTLFTDITDSGMYLYNAFHILVQCSVSSPYVCLYWRQS
jgi:hypothetical protein